MIQYPVDKTTHLFCTLDLGGGEARLTDQTWCGDKAPNVVTHATCLHDLTDGPAPYRKHACEKCLLVGAWLVANHPVVVTPMNELSAVGLMSLNLLTQARRAVLHSKGREHDR